MIDPRDLASAIKELRGRRTQRAVAKRAGIGPATWNAYEKGTRKPRIELIVHELVEMVVELTATMRLGSAAGAAATAPPNSSAPPW